MKTHNSTSAWIRCLTLASVLCLQAVVSRAALDSGIVYNFNTAFSGTAPEGSAPWLTATFQNDGSAGVLLTISGTGLENSGNQSSAQLKTIDFNLNPTLSASIPNLTFTFQSASAGLAQPTILHAGDDQYKADGDGLYDIEMDFSTSMGAFQNGNSITYLISGVSGLTGDDFAYQSTPAGGHGPFYAAAQIQNIGSSGSSGWVEPGAGPIPQISMMPEPATFGFAAAALAAVVTFRRKKSA